MIFLGIRINYFSIILFTYIICNKFSVIFDLWISVLQVTTGKGESQNHLSLKPTQEVCRMPVKYLPALWIPIKHRQWRSPPYVPPPPHHPEPKVISDTLTQLHMRIEGVRLIKFCWSCINALRPKYTSTVYVLRRSAHCPCDVIIIIRRVCGCLRTPS